MIARQSNLALDSPYIAQGPLCLKANKASIIVPGIEEVSRCQKLVQEKFSHRGNRSESLRRDMLKCPLYGEDEALIWQGYKDVNK